MRRLAWTAAAALLLSLFPLTCHLGPKLLERVVAPPPDPAQREHVRRTAWDICHRLSRRNGCRPLEEWPARDREVYESAARTLSEYP